MSDFAVGVQTILYVLDKINGSLALSRRTSWPRGKGDDGGCDQTADISPDDALALGIAHSEKVQVTSRRGEVVVKAKVTEEVPKGMVWMDFHFREGCANWLTNPAFDPDTLTAEYKVCAVRVQKAP
jgi:anaerobic selenocysteine-containing dehydrogenase